MTSQIIRCALFFILQFSFGYSRSYHFLESPRLHTGNNESGIKLLKHGWSPGVSYFSNDEIVVNPELKSSDDVDDYYEFQRIVLEGKRAVGIRIGIIIGSVVLFLLVLGCVLCFCRRGRQTSGLVLSSNRVELASEAQLAPNPVNLMHYPPVNENVQQYPPPYEPPPGQQAVYPGAHMGLEAVYPGVHMGQQYSPTQQQFQHPVPSQYGPPSVVKY